MIVIASALAPLSAFAAGKASTLSPCLALPRKPALASASIAASAALSSAAVSVIVPESLLALASLTPVTSLSGFWTMLTHCPQQMCTPSIFTSPARAADTLNNKAANADRRLVDFMIALPGLEPSCRDRRQRPGFYRFGHRLPNFTGRARFQDWRTAGLVASRRAAGYTEPAGRVLG